MDIRQKWNQRFSTSRSPNDAARVLTENTHLLPHGGRALDLACGLGGNALLLAEWGLAVDALDVSEVALEKLQGFAAASNVTVNTVCQDLETTALPERQYDVIVCSRYLYRPLCKRLPDYLNPCGLLFYQTFTVDTAPGEGPRNPGYLLENNELLSLLSALLPVYYREEGALAQHPDNRNTARFIGRKNRG